MDRYKNILLFVIFCLFTSFCTQAQIIAEADKFISSKNYDGLITYFVKYNNVKDDSLIYVADTKLIPAADVMLTAYGLQMKSTALYNKNNIAGSKKYILQLDSFVAVNKAVIVPGKFAWLILTRLFYIERKMGNYQKVLELIEDAQRKDNDPKHDYNVLYATNNIDLGYYDQGIALFHKSLATWKPGGFTMANIFNNIGEGYIKYYYKSGYTNYLDSALLYYKNSYELAKKDTANLAYTNALMLQRSAKISFLKSNYQASLADYEAGIAIPIVAQKPGIMQEFELGMADCYYQLRQYQKSNEYLENFYQSYKQLPGFKESLIAAYALSSQNYERLNNSLQSLRYAKLSLIETEKLGQNKRTANDFFHNKNLKDLNENAQKFINDQQNQKAVFLVIGVMLFLCILFMYIYMRQKNIINANKNDALKQQLLLSQMNPHFIFNSIDNIQSLIYNKQDKEAISYLTKFSKLTRQILENSTENYILLSGEISMLNNYLGIQKLLYNNNFTYSIIMDKAIDAEILLLPPMLTQPFIENAVKHGLRNKTSGGIVDIRFYMNGKQLFFEVKDNGIGLKNKVATANQKSLATKIVTERLSSMSKKKNNLVRTENIRNENNEVVGVKTYFEIPYVCNN